MSYNLDAVPILPPIQSSDYFNPQPEWKKSIASHLDELQAMGGGALGMAGTALGIEGLQKAGQEIYNRNMEESQAGWQRPAVPRVEDVRFSEPGGAGRALDFAMYQGPKALATIGESLLGGLGGGAIAKGLAKRGLSETAGDAAKQVLERQWMKGAAAGSLGTNAAMESSQAFGQMVQDGATPEDSLVPALAYGAASSATEAVPGYLMAKHMGWLEPFKDKVRKEILGDAALSEAAVKLAQSKLGKFTKGVVAGGAAEGLQEGTQQLLQIAAERVAKGDPMFASLSDEDKSQVLNSAVVGMLGGGLVGGPVGLMGGHGHPVGTTQQQDQTQANEAAATKAGPGTSIGDQTWMPGEKQPLPENWRLNAPGPRQGSIYDMEGSVGLPPGQTGALPNLPLEGEVINGQQQEPQRRLPWPAIEEEVVPDPTQIGEVPLTGDVVNGSERQKQRALPWPPLEGEVVDQQAIEQQRKLTGPRQLGAPSIVPQLARTTETPHLDETIDPNEWDQAFGQREIPPNEADFWNQVGKQEEANQQIHDQLNPTEWDQAFGTELVPENEVDFWRRMGEDLPGPVVRADGKPYVTQKSAEAAARRNGVDGPAIKIKGGFAVQPWTTPPVRPLSDKVQLNPTEPLGRIEQDPRLQDPEVRARMRQLADQAGWEQEGGRIIRDASGKVVDRTKWLPKRDWWIDRPRDVKPHHVQSGMAKIEKGEPLQTRERRAVAWLATMASADLHEENPAKWNLGEPTNAQQEPSTSTPDGSRSTQPGVRQEGGDLAEGRQGVQPSGQGRLSEVASSDRGRAQGEVEPNPFEGGSEFKFGKDQGHTTSPVQNPTTRERLESVLQDLTGRTSHWRVHIHETAPEGTDSSTYGWVQKENGKYHVHFILDRIEQGTELSKFLHEVGGHLGIDGLLAPGERKRLVGAIREWAQKEGMEGDIARAAQRRVEAAGTPAADQDSELIAYFLEEAVQRGITPTAKGGLGDWFRTLWAAFKRALRKLGVRNVDQLTPQHVVDLAYGAAKLELGTHVHGTATKFRRFDSSFMSAGAGDQWYSWGHYLAKRQGVGKHYMEMVKKPDEILINGEKSKAPYGSPEGASVIRLMQSTGSIEERIKATQKELVRTLKQLSPEDVEYSDTKKVWMWLEQNKGRLSLKKNEGYIYQVDTNVRPEETMHWDKPLSEQPQGVQDAINNKMRNKEIGGKEAYTKNTLLFDGKPVEELLNDLEYGSEEYANLDNVWQGSTDEFDMGTSVEKHIDNTIALLREEAPEAADWLVENRNRFSVEAVKHTPKIGVVPLGKNPTGREIYQRIVAVESGDSAENWRQYDRVSSKPASMFLDSIGIKGMEHWDEPSRKKVDEWKKAIARKLPPLVDASGTPIQNSDVMSLPGVDPQAARLALQNARIAKSVDAALNKEKDKVSRYTAELTETKDDESYASLNASKTRWIEESTALVRALEAFKEKGWRVGGQKPTDVSTNLVVFNDRNIHVVRRVPDGDMRSEDIRYGKLYTAPTVGPDANLNPPSYVNKILYDYTNGLADLKKLHPKLESLINRVASKRGSVLEHYHHDKVKPFTDKMADYKNLTGKSDEKVNLEFAARHVASDGENHLMALREAKHTAIEFEKVLRGIWKGMAQTDPLRAELGTLIREFTKGRANLMKGWAWDWIGPEQPTHHLTNRQVQERLVEKLESLLNTQLSNGNELWANFTNIKDMRMEWEALRNHGAGLQTKGTMSQRPSVRTTFEQWMGPQRMAELTRLDADTIWARAQGQQHSTEFLDLARRLDEVAADIRDQRVRGRLSTPGEATTMATDHPHWVPLRRESYDFEDVFGGTGASTRRMKARFGTPKIDPPIHVYQNTFAALDLTVTAAEANLARIELADTLRADPSLLEGWFEEPTSLPESQKRYDKQGFAQYTWKPHDKYSIPFLVDGDPWVIPIVKSNERAQVVSAAIQNLAPIDQRAVMTLFKNANKFLRWVIISANPAFTLTNAPKDFGHAMMTIQAGPLAKYSKEIAASYKDCFMELWRHFVLKQPSQTILDMEKAGGRITFIESLRPNDRGFGSVEKSVAWAQGGKVLRPEMARRLRDYLHMIEDVNIAVESVMRLAVWKAGKRHQAALGVTDDELGSLCKDVTVNYDRRGLRSHIVNAFYMFFNASVQGVAGVLDAAANGPNRVRFFKAIGGVMTAALLADLVGAALSPGWDDTPEDQKDRFARIPGSDLVLPGDTMAKVPLPWVFNVVWRAGEMLGEMVRGQISPARYVAKLLELTINSTNPIGGSVQVAGAEGSGQDFDFGAPSVMTMLTPSALDWFTQIQTNRDPFGRPMGPEKLPGEKYKPESEMSWENTPKFYKWVARELNAWTGGSQGESGLLDWRPSTYKTLVDTIGGGLGQVMTGLAGTAWGVAAGNPPPINRVPGAKSFFFTPSGQVGSGLYHERVARVEQARAGTKALQGLGPEGRPDLEALKASKAIELRMAPALDDTERQITDLRKQMKEAMRRGQDSRVEALKGRIKLAQERFNRVWERRAGG